MSIRENEDLISRYPFLRMKRIWDGCFVYRDGCNEDTYLDLFPEGWREALGISFCDEFLDAFNELEEDEKEAFNFIQIKEKFGGLRIYMNFGTEKMRKITHKYEKLSYKCCIECGAPAEYMSLGWINPYCGNCIKKLKIRRYISKEEYWREVNDVEE